MDIDKGRGNGNKLMNRFLYQLNSTVSYQLISLDGGSLRNAIPREAITVIAVKKEDLTTFKLAFDRIAEELKFEFQTIEKSLKFSLSETTSKEKAISKNDLIRLLNTLYSVPNGVFRMSPDINTLVEASTSLARVILKNGEFTTQSLQRSSVESTKDDVANAVRSAFENGGCDVIQNGDYPGWRPNPNSEILVVMDQLYTEMFNEKAQVKACHAGLECGILGKHLPNVDMISFGPNIRAAHSPDEKVQISSVQKFWKYYLATLERIPVKA
jgi:dipeptidase D